MEDEKEGQRKGEGGKELQCRAGSKQTKHARIQHWTLAATLDPGCNAGPWLQH